MEDDDVPLLDLDPITEDFQYPQFLHGIWINDAEEQSADGDLQRASSWKSNFGQEPSFQFSQPLSQILDPVEERQKVSRQEAFDLLRQVSSSTEAAQRAFEKVTGDEFLDASGEELQARDDLIEKIRKRLSNLMAETKKRNRKVKNPDQTFLSSSACEELFQLKRGNNGDVDEGENESVIRSESRGVQTDGGGLGPNLGPFKKPFDQLKVTGVYIYVHFPSSFFEDKTKC